MIALWCRIGVVPSVRLLYRCRMSALPLAGLFYSLELTGFQSVGMFHSSSAAVWVRFRRSGYSMVPWYRMGALPLVKLLQQALWYRVDAFLSVRVLFFYGVVRAHFRRSGCYYWCSGAVRTRFRRSGYTFVWCHIGAYPSANALFVQSSDAAWMRFRRPGSSTVFSSQVR